MSAQNNKAVKIVDMLIYFFSIIFLVSLYNSIFLNQLGYYLSLILIIVRFYLTKKNQFSKTGLEYALLFYIAAEILSTIFSADFGHSFHNLLKRFFLLPIIYTFIISANDFNRAKKFVIIYLGAAAVTMLVYLVLSYNYFINSLYQLYESGPSTFQYPITSSELMSFSLVIIFAFLVYEKMSAKFKLLLFVLFAINLLALLATYKRTGWIGAAAGILFVIIICRKWILLIPVLLLLIAGMFIEKNVSNVSIYNYNRNKIEPSTQLKTEGRAYNILPESNDYYVSDFENGLVKYKGSKVIDKYNFESPVIDFRKWKDGFYVANLIDTRFILMKTDNNGKLKTRDEFLTPGFLTNWHIANGYIYAIDSDSGLTIFNNPLDPKDKSRYVNDNTLNNVTIFADSSFIILFSKSKVLSVFSLNNFLPDKLIIAKQLAQQCDLVFYKNSRLVIQDNVGLKLFSIQSDSLILKDVDEKIQNVYSAIESGNNLLAVTTKKELFEIDYLTSDSIEEKAFIKLDFVPTSLTYDNGYLFLSQVKRSRMLSIFDKYLPSNFARLALWRAGFLIFKDYPVLGVGDIDLAGFYRQYKRNYDKEIQGHMHNNYVHFLVTLGIFGFIAVMFLLLKILTTLVKNYFILKDEPFAASYALGASGAFIAFLVSGLTEWNFGDHEIITMIWFILAMSIAFVNYKPKKNI